MKWLKETPKEKEENKEKRKAERQAVRQAEKEERKKERRSALEGKAAELEAKAEAAAEITRKAMQADEGASEGPSLLSTNVMDATTYPSVHVKLLKTASNELQPTTAKKNTTTRMIEVVLNDRLGKKIRVKCNNTDTVGTLKKTSSSTPRH